VNKHATAAALVSSATKRQIRSLAERDGLGVEDISEMLGVPPEIVADLLKNYGPEATRATDMEVSANADEDARLARIKSVETRTAEHLDDALDVLHELAVGAESEAVRAVTAQKLIEYSTGSLRPKKNDSNGNAFTIENMNIIINKAIAAHAAQLAQEPSTATVNV